jgi:Zn-dependent peptidase ImmA (M78 family)
MAEALHSIGRPDGLQFDLRWPERKPGEESPAYGALVAWAAGKLVWGQTNENGETVGVEWFWDDLLERLSHSWRYLLLEESYPLGLLPVAPQLLRGVLRERRIGASEEMIDAEDNSVFVFEEMHDLSRAIEGATLPKLFLLREGNLMLIATSSGIEKGSFRAVMDALEELGNNIADRIKNAEDSRTTAILEAWQAKANISDIDQVEITSGLPESAIAAISGGEEFRKFWEITGVSFEPNELMAAARMVGRLVSNDDTEAILRSIKAAPKIKTPRLDELSSLALSELEKFDSRMPHEQGRSLAEWFRKQPGIVDKNGFVDPEAILKGWGVPLSEVDLRSQNIDALCAWGARHGPAVLLNKNGRLSHFPTGRRSSLAHEICHLLVDRKGSLPVAEVFGGEVPKLPEQRANAFGAELLLSRSRARDAFLRFKDIERSLEDLAKDYVVSFEVAAWQLLNSGVKFSSHERNLLLKHTYRFNQSS